MLDVHYCNYILSIFRDNHTVHWIVNRLFTIKIKLNVRDTNYEMHETKMTTTCTYGNLILLLQYELAFQYKTIRVFQFNHVFVHHLTHNKNNNKKNKININITKRVIPRPQSIYKKGVLK